MLNYNFILPTSGSATFDGTIIILAASIFVVAYLYKNKTNLKSTETGLETNIETNINNNVTYDTNVSEELIDNNIQEENRNPNLVKDHEELLEQQEKIKTYN